MTILAIMSIVLALCGATVTGIKEARAAMSGRVGDLLHAAREAFEQIENSSGSASQANCQLLKTKNSQMVVYNKAADEKAKFDRAVWVYEKCIWLPIFALLVIASCLTIRLLFIPLENFKTTVTSPSTATIACFRSMLWFASIANLLAAILMYFARRSMRVNSDRLRTTNTTLEAGHGSPIPAHLEPGLAMAKSTIIATL